MIVYPYHKATPCNPQLEITILSIVSRVSQTSGCPGFAASSNISARKNTHNRLSDDIPLPTFQKSNWFVNEIGTTRIKLRQIVIVKSWTFIVIIPGKFLSVHAASHAVTDYVEICYEINKTTDIHKSVIFVLDGNFRLSLFSWWLHFMRLNVNLFGYWSDCVKGTCHFCIEFSLYSC